MRAGGESTTTITAVEDEGVPWDCREVLTCTLRLPSIFRTVFCYIRGVRTGEDEVAEETANERAVFECLLLEAPVEVGEGGEVAEEVATTEDGGGILRDGGRR